MGCCRSQGERWAPRPLHSPRERRVGKLAGRQVSKLPTADLATRRLDDSARTTMDKTLQQYDRVIDECLALFSKKAQDYGTAWRILRVSSLTDQVFIKAQRIRTLQEVGESKVGEGIRPELVGIVNYAAMALVQLRLGVVDTPDLDAHQATEQLRAELKNV